MNDELDQMIRKYGDELGRAQRREPARRGFPVRRVAIVGAIAGLALGVAVGALPGSGPGGSTAYAVKKAKAVLATNNAILHIASSTTTYVDGEKAFMSGEVWIGPNGNRAVFDEDEDGDKDQMATQIDVPTDAKRVEQTKQWGDLLSRR